MEYFWKTHSSPSFLTRSTPHTPSITPNVQRAVIVPWSGYETKGFWNRIVTQEHMARDIQEKHPELSQELVQSIATTATKTHFEEIKDNRKNPNSFAFLDEPLPEGTEWSDLDIFIDKIDIKNLAHSRVWIRLNGKTLKVTNFHEMLLEDTVNNKISVTGKILLLMCLWSRFSWDEEGIPADARKQKNRLSEDLQKFFGIPTDPFILEGREYKLKIRLAARDAILLQQRIPKLTEKVVSDLLNDTHIFS